MSKQRGLRIGLKGLWLAAFLAALRSTQCLRTVQAASLAVAVPLAWAAPLPQSAADGQAIFNDQCAGCHTIGAGKLVGPDLKGVTQQRDLQWLARFIAEPDKVLASGDPIAAALLQQFGNVPMPNRGLSEKQVAAVIAYLEVQSGAATAPQPTPIESLPAGDAGRGSPWPTVRGRGKALFMGNVHFSSDGPPCMGCHSIGSVGALGGGVLGPDLTNALAKYGDAGLAAALASIPWPTMKPVYADHALAVQEQADLRAFIQAESGRPRANTEAPVLVLSLAGFFAAMILAGILGRKRLRGVRRPLVERARAGK